MISQRIDAITQIPDAYRRSDPPAPRSVKVELTGRCNYQCGFCALQARMKQPVEDMRFPFFCRLVGEMREAGVEELGVFYIGESFMNPGLLTDAIWFAKHHAQFPYIFLTTNGSLATPASVQACMAAGLDSLKFSLNASDEEQFHRVMRVKPSLWEHALQNLAEARRIRDEGGYACKIYASSIQFDGDQQARMDALLDQRVRPYVDEHYWLPLYSMGNFATRREKELGYKPIAGNQGRIGALRDPLPCWSVFTEGHVTSSGMLSACCFDASGQWTMADLTHVSFMEGWHAPKFQALRLAHLNRDVAHTLCAGCLAYA